MRSISFLPGQLLPVPEHEARRAVEVLRDLGLKATVHGNFEVSGDDVRRLADLLGPDYLCQTFDAAMVTDSRGTYYDVARMADLLAEVGETLEPLCGRYGVEDFPLDAEALDCYRDGLAPLLERPAFGMLVDRSPAMRSASFFPSCTPHWSKESIPQMTPWVKTLCS